MNLEEEYKKHCELYDISFHKVESCLSYDDTTLFCPAGMQQFKPFFSQELYKEYAIGNIQRCLRLKDIEELGDGTQFGIFNMIGLFSFRYWTVQQAIDFWMLFLKKIGVYPDYVTIHPDKKDWAKYYTGYNLEISEDPECIWSDGEIGGFCTEFYKDGVEIGNIVNPLGTCIDVGFGYERLDSFVNPSKPKSKTECMSDIINQLILEGIRPSNKEHGYILRKLLRQFINDEGRLDHPFFVEEKERQSKILEKYHRIGPKHKDKSKEWWFDTHGVDLNLIPELIY